MKKLLLLSAFLIFACSSDDDSNSTAQLFLEKYDGVVWNEDIYDSNPDYSYKKIQVIHFQINLAFNFVCLT